MKRFLFPTLVSLAVALAVLGVLYLWPYLLRPAPVVTKGVNITVQTEVDLKDIVIAGVAGALTWWKMRPRRKHKR